MPVILRDVLNQIDANVLNTVNEIRIRRDKPLVLIIRNSTYFVDNNGFLIDYCHKNSFVVKSTVFDKLFMNLCDYSIHNNIENLKKGFLTLSNGARVGVASTAVCDENGYVSVKDIVALNIRVPQEVKGCCSRILNLLYTNDLPSIIVAGKPNSGKTTLLRDIARMLSSGHNGIYRKVAIIDERNEFAAKNETNISMDLGINTDVLTSFSKSVGIELATRTLSPELIICDEVATDKELESILYAFSSGVSFALSVHISDKDDLLTKPIIRTLLETREFSYIIFLDNYTYIPKIIDTTEVLNEIHRNDNSCSLFNYGGCAFC